MTAHVGPPMKPGQRFMFLHARQRLRKARRCFSPTYPAPTTKTHEVDIGLLVDISIVLNDIRTAADLGNLDRSHWAGKRRDGGCGVKKDQGVYVQIENLPYLVLLKDILKLQNKRGCHFVYIKKVVITRNLQ